MELQWDWSEIDLSEARFPEDFLWGTATAAHQVEGGNTNNNWARWETETDKKGKPRIHGGQRSGRACEHYERYAEDFRRMKEDLGLKSYRFSIEWSRIEPEEGRFDEEAIAHYHGVIDCLNELGIEPMVTLHHFTDPIWFADKGSFEEKDNIDLFVRFARRCFEEYGAKVPRWCTHNECGPYSVMGWGFGVFPPGIKSFKRMARVLCNLMHSHVRVYRELKAMPGGDAVEIGLVKNIFQFDPMQSWNPIHTLMCRTMERVYNDSVIGFMKTGVFELRIPFMVRLREEVAVGEKFSDFVGLNYYSNLLIKMIMDASDPQALKIREGQIRTDFGYSTYPEGFYRAIMQISELGLPIYITENGIPDDKDDRRADWIRRYGYAMWRAMQDGADVRGFHYWSLLDNFEWAEGYSMCFGLYAVDFETQERTLREGSLALKELMASPLPPRSQPEPR